MPTEIVRHLSPEEQELARNRQELAILRAELAGFEGRYLREVGILYAALDAPL
jgi:hypothetical protein